MTAVWKVEGWEEEDQRGGLIERSRDGRARIRQEMDRRERVERAALR